MSRNDLVAVTATLEHETHNAWLLDPENDEPAVWVPKSQCRRGDDATTWLMPEWMAEQKGLI